MRWLQDSLADFAMGMSSDPQVRQSTSFGCSGIDVVECRRSGAGPETDGGGLLDRF